MVKIEFQYAHFYRKAGQGVRDAEHQEPSLQNMETMKHTNVKTSEMHIGPFSYDEYLNAVKSFHGYAAPGSVMGGFMVDLALQHMPEGVLFGAICETRSCLPDAVQLLTPCTVGNGWLRILNLGRYALSFFDKYQGDGVRVFVDSQKLGAWPEVEAWMLKLKPKHAQDQEFLLSQIREAGRAIYGVQSIHIQPQYLKNRHKGHIAICMLCGEPYPAADGPSAGDARERRPM